jgi:hypothetical protein
MSHLLGGVAGGASWAAAEKPARSMDKVIGTNAIFGFMVRALLHTSGELQ